jgi:hypothetical protein
MLPEPSVTSSLPLLAVWAELISFLKLDKITLMKNDP